MIRESLRAPWDGSLLYIHTTSDQPIKHKQEGGKLITAAPNNRDDNNIQPIGLLSTLLYKASRAKGIPMAVQTWHVSIPFTLYHSSVFELLAHLPPEIGLLHRPWILDQLRHDAGIFTPGPLIITVAKNHCPSGLVFFVERFPQR